MHQTLTNRTTIPSLGEVIDSINAPVSAALREKCDILFGGSIAPILLLDKPGLVSASRRAKGRLGETRLSENDIAGLIQGLDHFGLRLRRAEEEDLRAFMLEVYGSLKHIPVQALYTCCFFQYVLIEYSPNHLLDLLVKVKPEMTITELGRKGPSKLRKLLEKHEEELGEEISMMDEAVYTKYASELEWRLKMHYDVLFLDSTK